MIPSAEQVTVSSHLTASRNRILALALLERFSYFSVRSLLILYLVKQLELPEAMAAAAYGSLTALVYTLPPLGACLVDYGLGVTRSLRLGSALLALAMILLAITAYYSVSNGKIPPLFLMALGVMAAAGGFFKPAYNTLLGQFTRSQPEKEMPLFFWAQLAVGLGAAIAPLIAGMLMDDYGFWVGFGLSAIAALALVVVGWNVNNQESESTPHYSEVSRRVTWLWAVALVGAISTAIFMLWGYTAGEEWSKPVLFVEAGVLLTALLFDHRNQTSEKQQLKHLLLLCGMVWVGLVIGAIITQRIQITVFADQPPNPGITVVLALPLLVGSWYGFRNRQLFGLRVPLHLLGLAAVALLFGSILAIFLLLIPSALLGHSALRLGLFTLVLLAFFETCSSLIMPTVLARVMAPHLLARALAFFYLLPILAYQAVDMLSL